MSESTKQPESKGKGRKSSVKLPVVSFLIGILLKIISVSIVAGGMCLLIEFGLYFIHDDAMNRSLERYQTITAFKNTGEWLGGNHIMEYTEKSVLTFLDIPTIVSRTQLFTDTIAQKLQPQNNDNHLATIQNIAVSVLLAIPDLMSIWIIVTFTWFAKLLSIISMVIPCLVVIGAGFVDGTVERKINTYKGARDSQDKIEWWFLAFKSSSYTVLFLYVAIPNTLEAGVVMLPSALVTAFFTRNVVASYKKYW
ncbi:DUF4400 domain-containing protein [Vibrio sp. 1180_3]|uniref:DUF4400 domain-containing protein n=1 Tax=Vibrio sp. 1180_3 TaxID=2528832 RepID=UPI002404BBC7|nr:DUF4400 domain-containing protein [Vibrio sp. 1180_3]MDF9399133.1 DUF4400 domain-containing protein [Vibrio sp. 1180_3]